MSSVESSSVVVGLSGTTSNDMKTNLKLVLLVSSLFSFLSDLIDFFLRLSSLLTLPGNHYAVLLWNSYGIFTVATHIPFE